MGLIAVAAPLQALGGWVPDAELMLDFLVWLPVSPYAWPVALGIALVALGAVLGFWQRQARPSRKSARMEAWFSRTREATFWLDGDLAVVEMNDAAAQLVADTRRSRRRAFRSLLDDAGIDGNVLVQALADDEVVQRNLHVEVDGRLRRLDLELQRLVVEGETLLVAVARDMTDYDEAHRLLQQFNRQVLDALPVGVVVMSPTGEYLYANRAVAPKREAQEWLRGKTDFEYCKGLGLHPEIALRRRSQRKLAVRDGKQTEFEEVISLPDGQERHFKRVFAPIFDLDGEVTAVVGCGVDVTARKTVERRAGELEIQRDQFERFKHALLDNVNHELRTPLTGIIGSAQILEQEVGEDVAEFAGVIVQNGRRLMQTLDALVELATIESRSTQAQPHVFALQPAVRRVVEDLAPVAEEKGLFLRYSDDDAYVLLRADPDGLHRSLLSLIGNAVKFTETGGVLVEVEADVEEVRIRVMDTGVGIDNGFLPYLFDAFHQESVGTTRAFEGIGLGLSVVKRHLDMMGATVTVDSEKGEGSMFTISLPRRFPNDQAPETEKPRVMLFNAETDLQRSMVHLLAPYVQIETAERLREAGEQNYMQPFDAVLLPLGAASFEAAVEALHALRKLERLETVPVIALDPQHRADGPEQALEAGFSAYVDRPFDKLPLLEAVSVVLENAPGEPVLA